jgi:two-component system, LytTR family, sensor kinase
MQVRGRVLAIVALAATLAAALSTSLAYQASRSEAMGTDVVHLAILNTTFWYTWAVLTLPLAALSQRFRIDRDPRVAIPVHIGAIVAAAAVHIAMQTSAQTFTYWRELTLVKPLQAAEFSWRVDWVRRFPQQLTQLIDWEFAVGAGIVGLIHALTYYRETERRATREAQLETRLVEAQLQMLQHQLHPHFLFNTLHAISALMHRDVPSADRMLAQLSDLLRLTLDSVARPEVRLTEEVEFLEKYMQIEQVRLGDRLLTGFEIHADVLDAVVPALILQPLVENAIKHGIAPLGRPGRVDVSARREGGMLVMTVEDSGPGPSDRAMLALSTGIGLSNTRARLAHQFGPNYRFEFQRRLDGFTALVAIPFRQEAAVGIAEFV